MILVDSSVWIDHLRAGEPRLVELLNTGRALAHPFVIGELACGNLKNRKTVCHCYRTFLLFRSPPMMRYYFSSIDAA